MDNFSIGKQLDNHEERIKKLEENDIQQRIQLSNIEKSLAETRLDIKASNDKLLDAIIDNNSTRNKIKLSDRKELWAIVSLIAGAILAYLGLK